MGWNEFECRNLVDYCLEAGIVKRHEMVNRNNPDWTTAVVRLVRTDERMRMALGFSAGPVSEPMPAC